MGKSSPNSGENLSLVHIVAVYTMVVKMCLLLKEWPEDTGVWLGGWSGNDREQFQNVASTKQRKKEAIHRKSALPLRAPTCSHITQEPHPRCPRESPQEPAALDSPGKGP